MLNCLFVAHDSTTSAHRKPSRLSVIGLIGLWIAAILTGLAAVARYESTPGTSGIAPERWPEDVELLSGGGTQRLLMFAHPHCPCTRASLAELERLLDHLPETPQVAVIFVEPDDTSPQWGDTSILKRAWAIPHVTAIRDNGGRLSRRFGMSTSGHVLLYDDNGALKYSGGITSVRGQEGICRGNKLLAALLQGDEQRRSSQPVYGCPLHDPDAKFSAKGAICPQP